MYTTIISRSVDEYIRRNGYFKQGSTLTLGTHVLRSNTKPFVDVMSIFMTHIESGRKTNLNLSQFLEMRLMNDLEYNSYVVSRSLPVAHLLDD